MLIQRLLDHLDSVGLLAGVPAPRTAIQKTPEPAPPPHPMERPGMERAMEGKDIAELREALRYNATEHERVLQELLTRARESAKPALIHAITRSARGYEKTLKGSGRG